MEITLTIWLSHMGGWTHEIDYSYFDRYVGWNKLIFIKQIIADCNIRVTRYKYTRYNV